MDIDLEIMNAVRDGIRKGVADKVGSGYDSPLNKVIKDAIDAKVNSFRGLLDEAIAEAIANNEFREQIKSAVRHNIAKSLVSRFGGEIEKQVNVLKSDPSTRARITLAIEEIVKQKV